MNDSGQMVGFDRSVWPSSPAYVWTPPEEAQETGTFSAALLPAPFGGNDAKASVEVVGIGNNGTVAGTSYYSCLLPGEQTPPVYCSTSGISRATTWGVGGGAGTVAASVPGADALRGYSSYLTISPDGSQAGGRSSVCGVEPVHSNSNGCAPGTHALLDGDLIFYDPEASTSITSRVTAIGDGGDVAGQWDACPPDPDDPENESDGVIFGGGDPTCLHMNPRAILADGTIYADLPMTVGYGTRVRDPDGTVDYVGCGHLVHDANEAGEVLVGYQNSPGNSVSILHQGTCYSLRAILPDGFDSEDWAFPTISGVQPQLTADGRISAYAWYKMDSSGQPEAEDSWEGTVLVAPQYPTWVQVHETPTDRPGEYDFERVSSKNSSTAEITGTTWEFVDEKSGEQLHVSHEAELRYRFQKPGRKLVTVTVDRANGTQSTHTKVIVVKPPQLRLGVSIPGLSLDDEIPVGTTFDVVVGASASEDGVGALNDLTYQEGLFTTDDEHGVLSYTTAAIPPFSLEPGTANQQTLKVVASAPGKVRIRSLLLGEDESGESVGAIHQPYVTVAAVEPGDPDGGSDETPEDETPEDETADPGRTAPLPPAGVGSGGAGTDPGTPSRERRLIAPAGKRVALLPRQRLSTIAGRGMLRVRMPMIEVRARAVTQVSIGAGDARRLGLKVRGGARAVPIGTGRATVKRRGLLTIKVRLTGAAKRALRSSRIRKLRISVKVRLTKPDFRAASVTRPFLIRR